MTNSSPKSWSVIKFPDEDAVSVVPTSWLQEDGKCFWPPYDQKLLRLAIERNQPPDPNWKTYPYVGFQNNVYDNFKEANKKSYVATNYSDLDSHSETVYTFSSKKRKIFKKSYSFSSTEEEDITLQPPPALKRRNEKTVEFPQTIGRIQGEIGVQHVKNKHQSCSYNSDSEDEVRTSMSSQMMSPSTYKKHPGKSLESRSGGHVTASTSLNRSSPDFAQQNKEVPRTNLPICSTKNNYLQLKSSDQPPDDTMQSNDATKIMNYLQHIIRKVNILQSIMVDMSSQLNDLQTKSNNNDVEGIENTSNSIFVVLDYLPVNSLIDMDRFESFLSNDEQMRNAIKEISKFGGSTVYEFIFRATQKLITNSFCGESYSYEGRRKKKQFRNLKLQELLIKSSAELFKDITIKDVETAIAKWLRRCAERGKRVTSV